MKNKLDRRTTRQSRIGLNKSALRIAVLYVVAGSVYIYVSESLLHLEMPDDMDSHLFGSIINSGLFVVTSALLIYLSVSKVLHKLDAAHRFNRDTLNAPPEHIAVLDEHGTILLVNDAWRKFARENGADEATVCEGANYLDVCRNAIAAGNQDASVVATAIQDVSLGERDSFSYEYACHSPHERRWFSAVITHFPQYVPARIVASHENITTRKLAEEKAIYLSDHDLLTGLLNRAGFMEGLLDELLRAHRFRGQFALITVDIDRLNVVNNAFGRIQGDQLIQEVAGRLKQIAREVDLLARHDGDQFLMLLRGIKVPSDAARVALRIVDEIAARPIQAGESELDITVSAGIAVYPEHGISADQLLANSEAALKRIKKSGRNNYAYFSDDLSVSSLEKLTLEQQLRRAIGTDQLYPLYQPQFSLLTGQVIGFEVLARWRSPELGEVSPGTFIPIAEESGLIIKIGEWILQEACKQTADWSSRGVCTVPIGVNVSALQFNQPGFSNTVEIALLSSKLAPEMLELELTESVFLNSSSELTAKFKALDGMGVQLTLDDFGTGYSSLGYLRNLPIRRLKIDKSFVRDLPDNKDSVAITEAIVAMGRSLGMRVIAEGVELAQQADFLRSIGCHEVQGYLYGKPMLPQDVELFIKELPKQARIID